MLDYQKFILIKGASSEYLKDRTIEYGEIVGGETRSHHIGIMQIDATDWHLIGWIRPKMAYFDFVDVDIAG
jgi:hypothetical protein